MRLAIADPPYLGKAARWYGDGRGIGGARDGRADHHPDAARWDTAAAHEQLVRELERDYDGWAIALDVASLTTYLRVVPEDTRIMVWHRRNAQPSGSRIRSAWEPVLVYVPPARRSWANGIRLDDVLDAPAPRLGFVGAKPDRWTRWVLDVLGYDAEEDTVVDLFPGSRAVERAASQGVLL